MFLFKKVIVFFLFALPALAFWAVSPGHAQTVVQSKGTDSNLNYESLKKFGPWDDRNYQLTREDLKVLSANEEELRDLIPAFYRVELRKRYSDLQKTGLHQYPHSAKPRFRVEYGGYLINGSYYRKASRTGDTFTVDMSKPFMGAYEWARKNLQGETRVAPGAETAIAINPVNPSIVVAGSNGNFGQEMHYSSDGGATWNSAGTLPGSCCDPTVSWSTDGTRVYTVTLGFSSNEVYVSTNNGQTWTEIATVGSGGVDKEYLHIDEYPTSPYKDHLYLTWHLGNSMLFSKSTDNGNNWTSPSTVSTGSQLGIGSDIASDKNGHVYYIWPSFEGGQIWSRKSTDGGSTWQTAVEVADTEGEFDFPIPAMSSRRVFIYTAVEADLTNGPYGNSLYVAYTDSTAATGNTAANNHARIQVAYSRDGGATWQATTPHSTANMNTVDRFHPWMTVDETGKVWVVFYSTQEDNDRTTVDFYYSVSEDGAQTWSTPERLTTVSSEKPNDDFEWGDYNGMDLVMGNLLAIYTDNRNEGGGNGDSIDVYVVGASVGTTGPEIFADSFESGDLSAWSN